MDESRLTEKPLGRKTIKTTSLTLNKVNKLIERIKINITNSNSKFYWVCPLIEESEELDLKAATLRYQHLDKIFKNKVLLMHGQLNEKEKDFSMEDLIKSKLDNEDSKVKTPINPPGKKAGNITALMPGKVIQIIVKEGQKIKVGDPLIIIESMKMENTISSELNGTIKSINIQIDDNVQFDQVLFTVI